MSPVADVVRLQAASGLASRLYRMHEAGQNYSRELAKLSEVVGKAVTHFDVDAAFGSVSPETFAEGLLVERERIPLDLSEAEMIELLERICTANGTEFQIGYWVDCLSANTGDDRISGLIFWPGHYFGDGNDSREMSPSEMLAVALANGRRGDGGKRGQ